MSLNKHPYNLYVPSKGADATVSLTSGVQYDGQATNLCLLSIFEGISSSCHCQLEVRAGKLVFRTCLRHVCQDQQFAFNQAGMCVN